MKSTVIKSELIKPAVMGTGIYEGTWTGYQVDVATKDGQWHLRTEDGIRGTSRCRVTVDENHVVTVETIKRRTDKESGKREVEKRKRGLRVHTNFPNSR